MRSWIRAAVADTVVVHTTDNRSIRGVLTDVTKSELILKRAQYLAPGGSNTLAGEVGIFRDKVAFIQRLTNGTESLE